MIILLLPLCLALLSVTSSSFTERLDFIPIQNGLLLAHFQFTQSILVMGTKPDEIDFGTFPGAIQEVVTDFGLEEFRLSFGRGRWDQRVWGQAPFQLASTGIQLHAWFNTASSSGSGSSSVSVQSRWERLTHVLSGLLCGSIGLLNEAKTTVPMITLERTNPTGGEAELRFGVLPREAVCTENLTPWIKMLPCMSNAGIASLLNPIKVYASRYNLMDMWVTTESTQQGLKIVLKQNLAVVYDLLRWDGDADWSLSNLFDRQIERLCPAACDSEVTLFYEEGKGTLREEATDMIVIDEHKLDGAATSQGEESEPTVKLEVKKVAKYRGKESLLNRDIGIEYKRDLMPLGRLPPSDVQIIRFITGSGQEKGTVRSRLTNTSHRSIQVTILEVLPWFMRLYLHTYRVHLNGQKTDASNLLNFLYSPAVDRVKPAQIEWRIVLPPQSTLTMEFDFDMALLRYSEYPLDPARGFDVSGALVTYRTADNLPRQIVSTTMLLTLPTPDFTMPFNVIMLTSLAITFFYGSFFNLVFRRFYLPDPANPRTLAGRIGKLFATTILPSRSAKHKTE